LTYADVTGTVITSIAVNLYRRNTVSRVQLALNVADLDEAVAFYSKLFATSPGKVRPGYANFAIAEPPLKLVLIAGAGTPGSLNHLGVEVSSTDEVAAATARLAAVGLATATEDQVSCCFAVQDKVWVDAPDGEPWEIYTVLADTEHPAGQLRTVDPSADADAMCCSSAPESEARCC
jgi:catechol 2,3-dioxygenase-like lactoylglutathione lyase family enzyme